MGFWVFSHPFCQKKPVYNLCLTHEFLGGQENFCSRLKVRSRLNRNFASHNITWLFTFFSIRRIFPPQQKSHSSKELWVIYKQQKNHWLKPKGKKPSISESKKIQPTSNTPSLKWDAGSDPTLPTLGLWIISWRPGGKPFGWIYRIPTLPRIRWKVGKSIFCIKPRDPKILPVRNSWIWGSKFES